MDFHKIANSTNIQMQTKVFAFAETLVFILGLLKVVKALEMEGA